MNETRIFPSWAQIRAFKPPLTTGEEALALFLDAHLPASWEIYVQPHMNGDRPDLVILNPAVGLMIFEVKDWSSHTYFIKDEWRYDVRARKNRPIRTFHVKTRSGIQAIASPVSQVERYRNNLIGIYLPQLGEAIDREKKRLAPFKTALYFHNMNTEEARRLVGIAPRRGVVFGRDRLQAEHLAEIVPALKYSSSRFMDERWAERIRFFLKPPFHFLEQGRPLRLTDEQKRHVLPASRKHQRLRGVAGSGKTLVLAQRAANLASQRKRVLVVYFNITLGHYIRDLISRARYNFTWEAIDFNHFHEFCKQFLYENDVPWPHGQGQKVLDEDVAKSVLATIQAGKNRKQRRYDAILIDEGQDFIKLWYDVLCCFLTNNDEVFLVFDERQNIYRRDPHWSDAMKGTKFRGRWRELKNSFRLPLPLLREANRFANQFLRDVGVDLQRFDDGQASFEFMHPRLIWREVPDFETAKEKILEGVRWLTTRQGIHPQDMVILVPDHEEGMRLVPLFEQSKFNVNHVFSYIAEERRSNKKSFWMNDGRLKLCTIHSFKGWELLNIILLTPDASYRDTTDLDMLIYTAITRARQNLIVYNRHPRYRSYGTGWPTSWHQPLVEV